MRDCDFPLDGLAKMKHHPHPTSLCCSTRQHSKDSRVGRSGGGRGGGNCGFEMDNIFFGLWW